MKKWLLSSVLVLFAALTAAQQQSVISKLEIVDISSGQRTIVKEFPYLIEAPNWTLDGKWLVYNCKGKLYRISPDSPKEPQEINTGYATRCNNDHATNKTVAEVLHNIFENTEISYAMQGNNIMKGSSIRLNKSLPRS